MSQPLIAETYYANLRSSLQSQKARSYFTANPADLAIKAAFAQSRSEWKPRDLVRPATGEPLAGLVEPVTFHNTDSGFCVLRLQARGNCDLVTVLGAAPSIAAGEYIQASGTWGITASTGCNFVPPFLRVTAPTSAEGMKKYLGPGLIKGIGPIFPAICEHLQRAVFEVIEHTPQRLLEVEGIGPKGAGESPRAGLTRRLFARSWRSCKAAGWEPRGRYASLGPTAPMPSRWSAKILIGRPAISGALASNRLISSSKGSAFRGRQHFALASARVWAIPALAPTRPLRSGRG